MMVFTSMRTSDKVSKIFEGSGEGSRCPAKGEIVPENRKPNSSSELVSVGSAMTFRTDDAKEVMRPLDNIVPTVSLSTASIW